MCIIATREGAKFWFGMDLPKHVISISRDYPGDEWKYYTIYDVLKKKRDNNEAALRRLRAHEIVKPCFVWVFKVDSWIFCGWWIYIKTIDNSWALNFRTNCNNEHIYNKCIEKAMLMFPCGILPMKENFETWANAFSLQYPSKFYYERQQGLKSCYCKIDKYGELMDIALDVKSLK